MGREREVAEVKQLISNNRLLTFTGSGGCGKTRLALVVALDVVEDFKDGTWWVPLAALSEPNLLPQRVAAALGVREAPGRSSSEALGEHLETKNLLLVLDNCEHLIDACAAFTDTLLHSCPDLHILATSREALGIAGERTRLVPSLSVPDPERLCGRQFPVADHGKPNSGSPAQDLEGDHRLEPRAPLGAGADLVPQALGFRRWLDDRGRRGDLHRGVDREG